MDKARVAVIGAGYWGRNLLRNFDGLGVLSAICDENPATLSDAAERYHRARAFKDPSGIFSDQDIHAVAIATPAETHYRLAREALLNGKDVFVEKPLSLSVDEGAELNKVARDRGRVLMVGHLLHYHPAVVKLKELIAGGALGRLYYIYSNRLNLGKIRQEENILWSFAPHDISVILALTGSMPDEVSSFGGQYLQERIADVTLSTLTFPGNVRAHVFVSWLHPYKEQKFVVVGSEKMAVFDDVEKKDKLLLYPHRISWKGQIPVPDKKDAEIVDLDLSIEPLREECRHFLDCIAKRSEPRTDGEEGLRVLRVLNACQRSLEASGSPMSVHDAPTRTETFFAHPTAVIDKPVTIGEGTSIWHFSHVLKGSKIGDGCKIGQNVVIGPNAVIGRNVKIQNNVSVYEGVTIEDDVFCGPSMVFTNVFNPRSAVPRMKELRTTLVKKGATIGANATIVCGNTIGRYAFVGAGAVVTRDVQDYALVAGNPAKQNGWICCCGIKLPGGAGKKTCAGCGSTYRISGNKIIVLKESL